MIVIGHANEAAIDFVVTNHDGRPVLDLQDNCAAAWTGWPPLPDSLLTEADYAEASHNRPNKVRY